MMRFKTLIAVLTVALLCLWSFNEILVVTEKPTTSPLEGIMNNQDNSASKLLKVVKVDYDVLPDLSNLSLVVELDEALSVIKGNLTIDYYNTDPISFDRIPFHLYPSGMQYENRPGEINILNVTTTDSPNTDLIFEVLSDQQLMWVNLTSPLESNQSVSFRISFNTTLPDGQDRANSYGHDSNQSRVYTCTAFYPIPCVYDEFDGWNIDEYLTTGDPFYFDMAYYDLIIEIPNGMVVAATGELLDRTTDGVTTIYHYNPIYPVREVVFSASRYFLVESEIVNGINISSYYLPHSNALWEEDALVTAVNSCLLFNESFGFYPYTTYNIVEAYGFYGGMEYPCQVQISESIADHHPDDAEFYQELVIAHETAHQWWCQLVGNDQIDWGHLDEGLTCWSTDYYFDYYNPDWQYFENYWALDAVRTYYDNTSQPSRINQSIYEFIGTDMSYRFTAYTKAPLILQKLHLTIGHENFIAGLRHFFKEYKFKIATFPNLQESFETITNTSLDWFFFPWFDNPYLPRYYYRQMDYNSITNTITVTIGDLKEDNNTYPYSQQLYIQVMDYQQQDIYYREQVWINGTTTLNLKLSQTGNPGAVLLMYESDVLVELPSVDFTALIFRTDNWKSTSRIDLVNFVELLLFLISFGIILAYAVWIRKKTRMKIERANESQ